MGFDVNDPELVRSSVHFWDEVDVWVHPGWRYFREAMSRERCYYFSAKATTSFWEADIPDGSCLVFGNETMGMPDRIIEKHPDRVFRIPMHGSVRNLNLATAVGIALYEALRKLGYNSDTGLPLR